MKFALALTDNKITMFDHVCHLLFRQGYPLRYEFEPFARELDADPKCNRFFYFVRKLPLRKQSMRYIFHVFFSNYFDTVGDNESDTGGDNGNVPNSVTDTSVTCGIHILHPCLRSEDILTAISNLNQTITHLHIGSMISMKDVEINVPVCRMDPNARYVHIKVPLPSNVQRDLGHQLSSCDKLQHIHIPWMTHTARLLVSNLGTKTNFTYLNLKDCCLSDEFCITLCEQFQFLHHLKYLELSKNRIGCEGAEHLAESIISWGPDYPLKKLKLSD